MENEQIHLTFAADRTRSRLTVFFRGILLIPHHLWLSLLGIAVSVMYIGHWIVAIFTGRTPQATYDFLNDFTAYATRVTAYSLYLTNTFPPFNGHDPYELTVHMPQPRQEVQGRASSFFRTLLALPAVFVYLFITIGVIVTTGLGWFAIMFTGRMPEGFQLFGERVMGYYQRYNAYVYLLVKTYPKLVDAATQNTLGAAPGTGELVGPGTGTDIV